MRRLTGNVTIRQGMKKIRSYGNASGIRYTIRNKFGVKGGRINK